MAWLPISGTIPQYSTINNALAADYYLKFYESGTTTPINMATDSTGGTLLAKCALSDQGYPITNPLDDSTRFIPHIDQDYRIVLFKSEADADANDTSNADFNIDGMALQVAPSADASVITLRDTTVEIQDDYDRSPLFIDTDGFTAGAGPHVVTVPTVWTPTNADMRFYKVDASGIVVPLTPTSTSATTFTLAETLLSTDVVFIGDDDFRSLNIANQTEANEASGSELITVTTLAGRTATETRTGVVEKATDAEMVAGTADKYPDAEIIKANTLSTDIYQTATLNAPSGALLTGSCTVVRVGDMVTISGSFTYSSSANAASATGFIPSWASPSVRISNIYLSGLAVDELKSVDIVGTSDAIAFRNKLLSTGASLSDTTTDPFTISYCLI